MNRSNLKLMAHNTCFPAGLLAF